MIGKNNNYAVQNLLIIFHTYLAIFVIAAVGYLVVKFCGPSATPVDELRQYAFDTLVNHKVEGFDNVLREKKEGLFFTLAIFFTSLISFFSLFFSKKYLSPILEKKDLQGFYRATINFSFFALAVFLFFVFCSTYHILSVPQKVKIYQSPLVICCGFFLALAAIFYQKSANKNWDLVIKYFAAVFIFLTAVFIASYQVFDQYSPTLEGYDTNFTLVAYPIVRQYLGSELLIDFKSYYGLFPYFMQLFLHIFPATILTLSMSFALLSVISFCAFGIFIFSIIENKFLSFLGFAALVFVQIFAVDWWPKEGSVMFQYEPLRLLFPTIILVLLADFCKKPAAKKYYLILILSAISVLWNFDSGFPILAVSVLILGYEKLKDRFEWKFFLIHLLRSLAIFISVFLALLLWVKIKSGFWFDISAIFYGQKAAVEYAIPLLPSNVIGLWWIYILIYCLGLVISINNFLNKKHSLQNSMILALTVLGCGLFVYYVGRSQECQLLHSGYPSLILLMIFADKFCRNFDQIKKDSSRIISFLPLFFISYLAVVFFFNLSTHQFLKEKFITEKLSPKNRDQKHFWIEQADFIRKEIKFDGKVRDDILLLNTNDQDFYFDLELRLKSPLNHANLSQVFYQKEINAIYDLIKSQQKKFVILFVSKRRVAPTSLSEEEMANSKKLLEQYYKLKADLNIGDKDWVYIYQASDLL